MKSLIRLGVVWAASSVMFSAHAADMRPVITKAPSAPAPVSSWTGCYIGGNMGGQWSHVTGDISYPGDTFGHAAVNTSRDFGGNGAFLYGGQIGCNWQPAGSLYVVGIEADMSRGNGGNSSFEIYRFPGLATDHFNAADRFGTQGSLRLKAGYQVDHILSFDRMLVYVAGGWSRAHISSTEYFYRDGDGSLTSNSSGWRDGWNIGVGADIPLANTWTLGLEYRFTNYGSSSYTIPGGTAGTLSWAPFTASADNLSTHDLRVRLNYLFGSGAGGAYARY
jgi:outer membrane immunogenic protein